MNKKPLHPRMDQIRRKGASRGFMTWVIHGDEQDVFWCVCQMLINRNPGSPKDISLDMRTGFGPMYLDPWWSRITANLPRVSSENSTDSKETQPSRKTNDAHRHGHQGRIIANNIGRWQREGNKRRELLLFL